MADELVDSISKLWEVLVEKGILDEEEVLTGIEVIELTTHYINTYGRFGDIP
jgi:hypothetical protein